MKYIFILLIAIVAISCNYQKQKQNTDNKESIVQNDNVNAIPLILPSTLENRRDELQTYVNNAKINISNFSKKYGWQDLMKEDFMDSVIIFDNKNDFNIALLKLAGADTTMSLPDTYCAALEKRTLLSVSPEFYSKVFPEGIEEKSFEKLLTHEIAHRLHVRILKGDEEAMGPIWFYEGFAMFVANQFSESDIILSQEEIIKIMKDPDRGSYVKYNYIFRYFAEKIPLKELISKAKNEDFNDELILLLEGKR
ncbi:MAG: hypothetical protein A2W91_06705 [Bacteroidetes bacterium GWF2_38_335]|nr:MAG: hypothetical protein A2W91_06705 [Bacteroidetes bacterium GWF2_38_335]OFY77720.1 MAG: hypothetical protein A2281_18220 [Bacteroidetes bacterium RIFOXYA12_FULL_38_20]HBS89048.1 hypothetical protein [Bacteroidales bacterium]